MDAVATNSADTTARIMKTDCGHGHVWPAEVMARCGGPRICTLCSIDAANKAHALNHVDSALSAAQIRALITVFKRSGYDPVTMTPEEIERIRP